MTPSEIRLIGRESNSFELVEAGLMGDWSKVLSNYDGKWDRPSAEQLFSAAAKTIARKYKVTVRTVRAWRRAKQTTQ